MPNTVIFPSKELLPLPIGRYSLPILLRVGGDWVGLGGPDPWMISHLSTIWTLMVLMCTVLLWLGQTATLLFHQCKGPLTLHMDRYVHANMQVSIVIEHICACPHSVNVVIALNEFDYNGHACIWVCSHTYCTWICVDMDICGLWNNKSKTYSIVVARQLVISVAQ